MTDAFAEAVEPFLRLAREVINPADYERPWHADSADGMVVFSFAGQSVTLGDLRRAAALAAPRPMPGREEVARVIEPWAMEFNGYNALAAYKKQEALKLADSILSLFSASLGGREDSPSRSQPSADAQERSPGSLHSDENDVRAVLGLAPVDPDILRRFGPPTYTEKEVRAYADALRNRP